MRGRKVIQNATIADNCVRELSLSMETEVRLLGDGFLEWAEHALSCDYLACIRCARVIYGRDSLEFHQVLKANKKALEEYADEECWEQHEDGCWAADGGMVDPHCGPNIARDALRKKGAGKDEA
jgi:hypothetical protein